VPAPIHSALSGACHKVQAWPRPEPRLKAGLQGGTALEFDTASVSREPPWGLHSPLAISLSRVHARRELGRSCFKACYACQGVHISDPIGLFSFSDHSPNATLSSRVTPLQAPGFSSARPRRICLSNSSALRAQPVNLFSHLQRRTRQTIYIIVIDISSFRYRAGCGGNYYYVGNCRGGAWPAEDDYGREGDGENWLRRRGRAML
jgi:hypothetical protein